MVECITFISGHSVQFARRSLHSLFGSHGNTGRDLVGVEVLLVGRPHVNLPRIGLVLCLLPTWSPIHLVGDEVCPVMARWTQKYTES